MGTARIPVDRQILPSSTTMCCQNAALSNEQNSARCWSVPMLIFGILGCLGFIVSAWTAGAGGILSIIASSLVLCCGPTDKGKGATTYTIAAVLTAIVIIVSC